MNIKRDCPSLCSPRVGIGVAALALSLLGYTFPGVIPAPLPPGWAAGRGRRPEDKEGLSPLYLAALGCGGLALAIGFIALVQTAYPS